MHPRIKFLTLPKVAALLGVSAPYAWRRAHAGDYGKLNKSNGVWDTVEIAEVEKRKGIIFSPEQVERAAAPSRKSQPEHFKPRFPDPSAIALIWLAAGKAWMQWARDLRAGREVPPGGPLKEDFEEIIKKDGLFTRDQLDRAIHAALDQRDAEWSRWVANRAERALNPSSPYRNETYWP